MRDFPHTWGILEKTPLGFFGGHFSVVLEVSTGEWIDQLQLRQVLKLWQQQALEELGNPGDFLEGCVVMWGFVRLEGSLGSFRDVGGWVGWSGGWYRSGAENRGVAWGRMWIASDFGMFMLKHWSIEKSKQSKINQKYLGDQFLDVWCLIAWAQKIPSPLKKNNRQNGVCNIEGWGVRSICPSSYLKGLAFPTKRQMA